ncbi:hypothetical protein THAOC_29257, partial [Thalassiosira oceanica]
MWKGEASEKNSVGLVLTRLPFGSSPAPDKFCTVSETVFDLGGDLLTCDEWDPTALPSPYADVIPQPKRLDDEIPFGVAEEADVSLDESCVGGVDGYIDDGITVALDTPETTGLISRAAQAVAMALFLIFRPLAKGLASPCSRPPPGRRGLLRNAELHHFHDRQHRHPTLRPTPPPRRKRFHQLRRPEIGHQKRRGHAVQERRPGVQP